MMAVLTPTDLPLQIEKRSARVAGIDRGISLNEILEGRDAQILPPFGADDADSEARFEGKRSSDGDDPFADFQFIGVAEGQIGQIFFIDFQEGEIGSGIGAAHCGGKFPSVVQDHGDLGGVFHHVVICHDKAIRADEKARAAGHLRLLLGHFRHPWHPRRPKGIPKKWRKKSSPKGSNGLCRSDDCALICDLMKTVAGIAFFATWVKDCDV